jgi:hemolysin D
MSASLRILAWKEWWARHAAVARAAWQMRHELAGPRRETDELAFLPAHLSWRETPPHPAPRRVAWALCGLLMLTLAWACWAQVDIVAIAAGRIVVSQRNKTIQPLEASVVKAIHVKDGDRVSAGQLLVELDATAAQADGNRVAQERADALADGQRTSLLLTALSSGSEPRWADAPGLDATDNAAARIRLATEWGDIAARLHRLQAEAEHRQAEIATAEAAAAKLRDVLPLSRQREADYQALIDQGYVAGHAGQDRSRERLEIERDLTTAQARQAEAQAALRESTHAREAYLAEMRHTLRERQAQAELKLRQWAEEATKARQRTELTSLRSPVAGTVQQLAVHTSGGVVTPAQVLLVVVPDEAEVGAEVMLENKDIGFVREGQEAEIKVEAFPFSRYGTVPAVVARVSADAVVGDARAANGNGSAPTALYPTTLSLARRDIEVDGKRVRLSPGMNVVAEVKTGKRRVIDYLLSPLRVHVAESLKER